MPYWDHKKAIGSAGGLFAVPIYPPAPPYGGLRGVPLRLPELASLGSRISLLFQDDRIVVLWKLFSIN